MSSDVAPTPPHGPHRIPSTRETRIRRRVSLLLSIATITGASATVLVWLTSGFRLDSGTDGLSAVEATLWNSAVYWIVPGVVSLVLLSSLPRPVTTSERAPKPLAIIALTLSAMSLLYPVALMTLYAGSFVLAPVFLLFQ